MKLGDLCGSETERLTVATDQLIDYIDISSVSNESKSIIGKQTLKSREAPSRAQRILKSNDILVSTVRPNLNAVAVYDGSFKNLAVASTGFCVLRCKPGVNHRFIFNICKSRAFIKALVEQATGASYPAVNEKIIRAFEFPDVTYECQEEVSARLDTLQRIIDLRKQQLRELDDLIKARFVEMFGDPNEDISQWPEVQIGDHCFVTKLAGFEYTEHIHYEDSGDVVMVKAQNVKHGTLNDKDLSYISKKVSDSLPRSQLAPGDVVMTYVGANIGDVAIIDDKHIYHLAPNVAKIRPDGNVYNSVFFMHMLMLKTAYIMRNSADTAKAALGMERIRKLKVFLPTLCKQNEFAIFVSQVDKSKVVAQKALDEAKLLYESLMQKYFD